MQWTFNNFWNEYRPAISAFLDQDFKKFSRFSAVLFPTQAKCFYYSFGPSGTMEERDALCFLPQNTVNEKIFIFLYLWIAALTLASIFSFLWTILQTSIKFIRIQQLCRASDRYIAKRQNLFFDKYSSCGYWFILCLLHRNLSPILFKDLVTDLMETEEVAKPSMKTGENEKFI